MKLTTFASLEIGTKFVLPGGTTVYQKRDAAMAASVKGRRVLPLRPDAPVVPEYDASPLDILNSWSNLNGGGR